MCPRGLARVAGNNASVRFMLRSCNGQLLGGRFFDFTGLSFLVLIRNAYVSGIYQENVLAAPASALCGWIGVIRLWDFVELTFARSLPHLPPGITMWLPPTPSLQFASCISQLTGTTLELMSTPCHGEGKEEKRWRRDLYIHPFIRKLFSGLRLGPAA